MQDFKQVLTEEMYSRQEELTFWDCDRDMRVRVAAILSKIGAFGGYHYDALGFPREMLIEKGFVFLLSRTSVHFHRVPRASEVLTINTWENGAKGAQVQRVFQMLDEAGSLCISARSDWVLADPNTHKMLRPSAFTLRPLGKCPVEIDCPEPKKIILPKEGLEELGGRKVVWSDLDGNGHLFSGNYGDIVWDYLPADLQGRTVKEFAINYSREAKFGDSLRIRGIREENAYLMEGLGSGGVCFTARCVFSGEEGIAEK